jgi:ATP-binding cassette subfamily B protein
MAETKTHPAQHPVEVLGLTDTVSPSKGLRTMWRVFLIGTETPCQMAFALVSTLFAAVLQLTIPQLLGRAVDQTQVVSAGADAASTQALLVTALLIFGVSTLRGLFATFQN